MLCSCLGPVDVVTSGQQQIMFLKTSLPYCLEHCMNFLLAHVQQ